MKTIFYTAIEFAPGHSTLFAPGVVCESLPALCRHAHVLGYELVPFGGWTNAHARTGQIQENVARIDDLMDTIEIRRAGPPGDYQYYPIIRDMRRTRCLDDEEGEAIIRLFTGSAEG